MTIQLAWFALFAVALYFIVSDESIAAAFYYVISIAKNFIKGRVWLITNDPRNPVVKYLIYRRSLKLARELTAKINNHIENNKD
jgi:hypothetical protein